MRPIQSGTFPRAPQRPSIAVLGRDPHRLLDASDVFEARCFPCSVHLTPEGFWATLPSFRPTVLALELVRPLLAAARTHALATELLGYPPGLVVYGAAPSGALVHLRTAMPKGSVVVRGFSPEALVQAALEAYAPDLHARPDGEGELEEPETKPLRALP